MPDSAASANLAALPLAPFLYPFPSCLLITSTRLKEVFMSENNYGALMLKSALDTSVDVTKIIARYLPGNTGQCERP